MAPTVSTSSVPSSTREIVFSTIKSMSGFAYVYGEEDAPKITHLIIGDKKRTAKLLFTIARGGWVLTPEWVFKSIENGSWLPEESFEAVDLFPGARKSRLARTASLEDDTNLMASALFGGKKFHVFGATAPPEDDLELLIELCGGQVVDSFKKADVVVLGEGYSPPTSRRPTVGVEWILDSISGFEVLPLPEFTPDPDEAEDDEAEDDEEEKDFDAAAVEDEEEEEEPASSSAKDEDDA